MTLQNSTWKRAAERINHSEFVIPVFIAFLALFIMSVSYGIEDYWTSYWGYIAIPTNQGMWWQPYFVAALPTVGQICAGYISIALGWEDERDRKYAIVGIIVWVFLFLLDTVTDVLFRMGVEGADWKTALWAIFQTLTIFTLGSEVSFTVGFGMVFHLAPYAMGHALALPKRVSTIIKSIKGDDAPNQPRPPHNLPR